MVCASSFLGASMSASCSGVSLPTRTRVNLLDVFRSADQATTPNDNPDLQKIGIRTAREPSHLTRALARKKQNKYTHGYRHKDL